MTRPDTKALELSDAITWVEDAIGNIEDDATGVALREWLQLIQEHAGEPPSKCKPWRAELPSDCLLCMTILGFDEFMERFADQCEADETHTDAQNAEAKMAAAEGALDHFREFGGVD